MGPYSIFSTRFHWRDLVKRVPLRNRTPASSSSSLLGVRRRSGGLSVCMSAKPMKTRTQAKELEGWARGELGERQKSARGVSDRAFMKTPRSGFEPEHPARQAGIIDR